MDSIGTVHHPWTGTGGRPVIAIESDLRRRLAPDLVITQGLCDVCAVASGEVHRLADALDHAPRVLSLAARNMERTYPSASRLGR